MKVNGIDLKEKYGEKIVIGQQTVHPRNIITFTDWLEDADQPVLKSIPKQKFFDVVAEFIVIGETKTDAEITMSNIQSDCNSGMIELDNFELTLRGESKEVKKEFLNRWRYHMTITFQAWEKADEEIAVQVTGTKTIVVEGNSVTPCIVEITPLNDNSNLTITGIARDPITGEDEPVTIKNLKKSIPVIVDGETCTVTQQGANKYPETDFWEFPSLLPGENQITLSNAANTVTIKYRPRYI